jgi:hypothetical protein
MQDQSSPSPSYPDLFNMLLNHQTQSKTETTTNRYNHSSSYVIHVDNDQCNTCYSKIHLDSSDVVVYKCNHAIHLSCYKNGSTCTVCNTLGAYFVQTPSSPSAPPLPPSLPSKIVANNDTQTPPQQQQQDVDPQQQRMELLKEWDMKYRNQQGKQECPSDVKLITSSQKRELLGGDLKRMKKLKDGDYNKQLLVSTKADAKFVLTKVGIKLEQLYWHMGVTSWDFLREKDGLNFNKNDLKRDHFKSLARDYNLTMKTLMDDLGMTFDEIVALKPRALDMASMLCDVTLMVELKMNKKNMLDLKYNLKQWKALGMTKDIAFKDLNICTDLDLQVVGWNKFDVLTEFRCSMEDTKKYNLKF